MAWAWLTGASALALLTGALPLPDALAVLVRIAPVLVFLAAVTVLAELADAAGVFAVAADRAARAGRGSVPRLFLLVAVLGTVTTVVLSLDTTAVLLTPVVLVLAARLHLPAVPFAVLTVWLANTASLLLPVSNLTNLLAAGRIARSSTPFVVLMAPPAAAVLAMSLLVVGVRYARRLRGRYALPAPVRVPDPVLLAAATAACLLAGVLFALSDVLGVDVAVPASGAAAVLLAAFAVRAPSRLTASLVPWRLVLTTVGLFLLVQTALDHGLRDLLSGAAGTGTALPDLLRLAGTAAGAANLVNNLPAYLALEPAAGSSPLRVAALLVGVDAGPLVLPWGSLATLLWWDRCRARGVMVPAGELVLLGLVGVPLVLLAGVGALALAAA